VRIENKVIPEGINTTDEHPLKEFALLTFGIVGILIALVVLICFFAELLAPFVPFSREQKIAAKYQQTLSLNNVADKAKGSLQQHQQLTAYLQQLADSIANTQSLPADMSITVHYMDTAMVNAFATLGGHIFVFRGLLEILPDENALAWVMAHEIAHIKNRDPIRSLGRGVIIGVVVSIAGVAIGNDMVESVLGQSGLLTVLKFSRDQEQEADIEALYSIHKRYGHVGSAGAFFSQIKQAQNENSSKAFEFFDSHPLTENRINKIEEVRRDNGWQSNGKINPLPKQFRQWIKASDER